MGEYAGQVARIARKADQVGRSVCRYQAGQQSGKHVSWVGHVGRPDR